MSIYTKSPFKGEEDVSTKSSYCGTWNDRLIYKRVWKYGKNTTRGNMHLLRKRRKSWVDFMTKDHYRINY